MIKYLCFFLVIILSACATLTSNTIIKANDSFILGNNQHGIFKVKLENVSKNNLEVYHAPIAGGKHSTVIVKPNDKVSLKVDANTALFIQNKSNDEASVNLKVRGDTGLSMGYQK
jgi:hypothetical protein